MSVRQTVIEAPDTSAAEQENTAIVSSAKGLAVVDKDTHGEALGVLRRIAGMEKQVKDLFADPKRAAHAAHKAITAAETKLLAPLVEARQIVSGKVLTFESEERRKAEALARQQAEEARRREEEAALADAIDAEARGDAIAAEDIISQQVEAPVIVAKPELAKVEGVATRSTWSGEVVDLSALVAYVAAHPEWGNLLSPNQQAIDALARAQRAALKIPGLRAVEKRGLSVRAS